MVRNTYTRYTKQHDLYQRRSSVYMSRWPNTPSDKPVQLATLVSEEIQDEQYVLPPKRPTPTIALRENSIMRKQRIQNVL